MLALIRSEPILFQGLVQALITLVTAFGLHLSVEQIAAINITAAAALSVIARQLVTPTGGAPPVKAP